MPDSKLEVKEGHEYLTYEHKPTPASRSLVSAWSALGVPQKVIIEHLKTLGEGFDICHTTLRRHYKSELKMSRDHLLAYISAKAMSRIEAGDTGMMRFFLSNIYRWGAGEEVKEDTISQLNIFNYSVTDQTGAIIEAEYKRLAST